MRTLWISVCLTVLLGHAGSGAADTAVGFAALNGGTTGGGSGPVVTATTGAQFRDFAEQNGPLTIRVEGVLNHGGVEVASDKTIIGVGSDAALVGKLGIDVNNVIVRNLSISNPSGAGGDDAIELSGATNVWIDHNNIFDAPDGVLDIVRGSDFVTVSWNKFFYTQDYATNVNTGHRFALLLGNSDNCCQDRGKLRVTLHHNHWGAFVKRRMPRVRYGDVHVFNEYFNSVDCARVIRVDTEADVLVENNYFEDVNGPFEKTSSSARVEANGNVFVNTTGGQDAGDNVFDPPYAYTLDDAQDVKDLVLGGAGVGNLCTASAVPSSNMSLAWDTKTRLSWNPSVCATSYNVYRLTAGRLPDADDDRLADDYGACDQGDLGIPEADMPGSPASSLCDYILISADNFAGESTLGYNGAASPLERPNLTPCP